MHNKLALCLAVMLLAGATYALSACTLVRAVTTRPMLPTWAAP